MTPEQITEYRQIQASVDDTVRAYRIIGDCLDEIERLQTLLKAPARDPAEIEGRQAHEIQRLNEALFEWTSRFPGKTAEQTFTALQTPTI